LNQPAAASGPAGNRFSAINNIIRIIIIMQENSKGKDGSAAVEKLFLGAQETYHESQKRTEDESKPFQKTEFFRMDRFGVYRLRILPLAPNRDGSIERKSYEYSVHQLALELERPADGDKPTSMYVTVPRATDANYSIDLIDAYRKLAVETAKTQGDDRLADKIAGGTFGGGLKFSYAHALYILDFERQGKRHSTAYPQPSTVQGHGRQKICALAKRTL
jgi:hypothetical protein